jgi:hypothetical protein
LAEATLPAAAVPAPTLLLPPRAAPAALRSALSVLSSDPPKRDSSASASAASGTPANAALSQDAFGGVSTRSNTTPSSLHQMASASGVACATHAARTAPAGACVRDIGVRRAAFVS